MKVGKNKPTFLFSIVILNFFDILNKIKLEIITNQFYNLV